MYFDFWRQIYMLWNFNQLVLMILSTPYQSYSFSMGYFPKYGFRLYFSHCKKQNRLRIKQIKLYIQIYCLLVLLSFIIHLRFLIMGIANKCLYWANKFLRKIDLFPTNNFVRYNGQSEYTTVTGGLASLAVFIIFTVLFASMGLRTLDRKIIQSAISVTNDIDPPVLKLKTSIQSNFMFAVSLFGFDLTNTNYRLFNVTLWQEFYGPGYQLINSTQVSLVPCTKDHFAFGKDIQQFYYKFNMSQSLCPLIGQQFQVEGKPVSNSSSFTIQVGRCDSAVDPLCVSNTTLDSIQQMITAFTLVIPVINVQLNPGSSNYKSYFLQDRNYFQFNSAMGMKSMADLQQSIVNTDISIMPYQDIHTQNFTVIPKLFTNTPYIMSPNRQFAAISFSKASTTATYDRSFSKVDSYFSYVGGLIGTIIGLIFILQMYTQTAYEISISHKLFKDPEGENINSGSFNIFYFVLMGIKKIINLCKCNINWPKTQTFIDCCDQINFQLDITYILKKLLFLQSAFEVLLRRQHFQTLHLKEKPSINQAKHKRLKHFEVQLNNFKRAHSIEKNKIHNNQISQQSIVIGRQKVFPQKHQNNSEILEKITDFSALSISPRSKQGEELRNNVLKVVKEYKRGDVLSKKVLQKIDKNYFQSLKSDWDKQNSKQGGEPGPQSMDFIEMKEIQQKKNSIKIQNFDYEIEK